MSRGRCPGCGTEDPSCKAVRTHMNECPQVIELYRDPATRSLVIDPEDEYRRFRAWLDTPEGQEVMQAARDDRDSAYRKEFSMRLAREQERWTKDKVTAGSG